MAELKGALGTLAVASTTQVFPTWVMQEPSPNSVMVWICVTDCMALALRSAKGVGGHRPNLSDAGGRSDDCMPRSGSNLNH
ncbi:hypothetical protein HaLaN_18424 [Haematococcus lacustris]|uniref:Uncharacterized protein n=1 Tax=Haematococcus lacustris TaxID=44745 RepID=A0A699ZEN0_HAELA|nr:hypothetical protein HaLaN_18424 [Haematococcus lacustris]